MHEETCLNKLEWQRVLNGLNTVAPSKRTKAWERAKELVEGIVSGKNELAQRLLAEGVFFNVTCRACGRKIKVYDDYVYKGLSGEYVHYDCLMSRYDVV
jgi:hypothetical protein